MSTLHVNTVFIFREKYLILSLLKSELTEKCVTAYGRVGLQKKIQEHYIEFFKRLVTF